MKRIALKALVLFAAAGCVACSRSNESSFYRNFSLQKLVGNGAHIGLDCGGVGGGGGGGGSSFTFLGSGSREFHSQRGEGYVCNLKSDGEDRFDEAALIAGLAQDVQNAISISGAKIIDSGNHDSTSFYFGYALDGTKGSIEISGRKLLAYQYSLQANLEESGKSKWW
jgi:hypothetical protein